jgi:hypothetical protein
LWTYLSLGTLRSGVTLWAGVALRSCITLGAWNCRCLALSSLWALNTNLALRSLNACLSLEPLSTDLALRPLGTLRSLNTDLTLNPLWTGLTLWALNVANVLPVTSIPNP